MVVVSYVVFDIRIGVLGLGNADYVMLTTNDTMYAPYTAA